jgi:hypothetical protein
MFNKKVVVVCVTFLLLLSSFIFHLSSGVYAAVPLKISHQGRLTNNSGVPLNGSYSVAFRIYDAASGGTMKWTETQNAVTVTNGVFSTMIGTSLMLGTTVFDGTDRYLETVVNGETLTPRILMGSVPHAYVSEKAYYLTGTTVTTSGGNLGLGTTNPVGHLSSRRALIVADTTRDASLELWGSATGKSFLESVGGDTYLGNLVKGTGVGNIYIASGDRATAVTVNASGNVGVGVTNPAAKLDVVNSFYTGSGNIIIRAEDGASEGGQIQWLGAAANPQWYTDIYDTTMRIYMGSTNTDNTNMVKIFNALSGNVGLYVQGNVGIGQGNPTKKLDVVGEFQFANTLGDNIRMDNGKLKMLGPNAEIWMDDRRDLYSFFIAKSSNATTSFMFRRFDYGGTGVISGVTNLMYIDNVGNLKTKGTMLASQSFDLAEVFDVTDVTIDAGDVVVLDAAVPTKLKKCDVQNDTAVIGIISTEPGILLDKTEGDIADMTPMAADKKKVALTGRVPCKVCDENGSVRVGDLLTTSSIPGYAMKSTEHRTGTIIGKAMEPLSSGCGKILVFILK